MIELAKQLDELLEDEEQAVSEGFRINDLQAAVWADNKVHDAEVKIKEIEQLTADRVADLQAKIDRLNEWKEQAQAPYLRTVDFFKPHLFLFLDDTIRSQAAAGAKKLVKSIALPYRTLSKKAQQPEIVKNDDALLAWAEENAPDYVERKPVVKWGDLKKTLKVVPHNGGIAYVTGEGMIVEGVTVTERGDALDWKVKE